jgi:hypothetical protein
MRSKSFVPALVVAHLLLAPGSATAADCGRPDPDGAGTLTGTLTLDAAASTVRSDFGREDGSRTLQLVFNVARCDARVPPRVSVAPSKDVAEIPSDALGTPRIEALGHEVKITYTVRSDSFDPGTYGSFVTVSDQARLTPTRTPITLSRSESSILVPGMIGLLFGAAGFAVFYWSTRLATQTMNVTWRLLSVGVLIACVAGALSAIVNWLDHDLWVPQDNWQLAAATAFTQSTAGALVVMLGSVFSAANLGSQGLRTTEQITRDVLENTPEEAPFSAPTRNPDDEPLQSVPAAGTPPEPVSSVPSRPDADAAVVTETNGNENDGHPADAVPVVQRPASEVFLLHMQEEAERQSHQVELELNALRRQERMVFSLLIGAAAITLLLLVIAAVLVLTGVVAVGVVSGLVALFPGTGTVILRRLERRIGADKDDVSAVRADNVRLLQAIQITLLIDDAAERGRKVGALSDELVKSALGGRTVSR